MSNVSNPETLNAESFTQYLLVQVAFLQAVEARLQLFLGDTPLACRLNKAALAKADLRQLSGQGKLPRFEIARQTSFIDSHEHALGSLYVIEGSTLGMKLLAKALATKSWARSCSKLVNVYGPYRNEMWRNFQIHLNDTPPESWEACKQGALGTFNLLLRLVAEYEEMEIAQ